MAFVARSIAEVLMNKIALLISIRTSDWTTEIAITASNESVL